jgi:hypothetical protein
MQGPTKIYVEVLMYQLGEARYLIKEKEAFEREAADDIGSLSISLEEEKNASVSLKEKLLGLEGSHNLNTSKLTKERDHTLAMVKVLKRRRLNLTLVMMVFMRSMRILKRLPRPCKASSQF